MPVMRADAAALLRELDLLAYPDRMRLLAGRARELAAAGALDPVVGELYGGDRFQREMAVFMAVVAGHLPTIEAALSDPAWEIHRPAVSAWLRSGVPSAGQVAGFVAEASWHTRRHVYQLLRRQRLAALADGLIDAVWDRFGDVEAARLLLACSAEVVERLLPELGYAVGDWSRLGSAHPAACLNVAEAQLAELSVADRAAWWARSGGGVLAAASGFPSRVLDLLERHGPEGHLPGTLKDYAVLADAAPGRLIGLMSAPGRARWVAAARLPGSLLGRLARLEVPELAPLARRLRYREQRLAALLGAVPPARRAVLYEAAYAGVERGQARPADEMLDVLPRTVRAAEAMRILELGPVRADAALTLHYTAFLPWQQAKAPLTAATARSLAEDRAAGYGLLVACASRSGDAGAVTEVIGYLRRLRNEQDPVRARALTALAQVRPLLLQPQAADALEQIAADALAARDGSGQTRQALTTLAVTVLRHHAGSQPLIDWSLQTLQAIFGDRVPALGRVDSQLRHGQEHDFFAAVREWLEAGTRRGSCEPLFAVTRALGRRAWQLPALQEMLRRVIDPGNVSSVMRTGITLWLADPETRSQRVEQVLRADSSAVVIPEVWTVLCRRRTDLVDRFLAGEAPRGKFIAAGVRWVPLRSSGTSRWLPRQQAAYAGLLAGVAADAGAKMYQRTGAIATAARAGDAGWDVVQRYLGSASTSLAEAALGALAWAGRPGEALPILLSHAGDDQARAAIYAAGRVARFIPPAQLEPMLTAEPVAVGKVTTRKETLRLAAALSVPAAGTILWQAWTRPGQHRDVRAAIAAAACQRPHDPASWPILGQAATGTAEEAQAIIPADGPLGCAPRHRHRYGQLITQVCHSTDQATARKAWQALPGWAAWTPEAAALITGQLADLEDRVTWRLAVPTLLALLNTSQPGPLLGDITARLAGLDQAIAGADEPGRDRPARQRLTFLIQQVESWGRRSDTHLDRTPLADAGRNLATMPDFTRQAVALLIGATSIHQGAGQRLASQLTEICDLLQHQDAAAAQAAKGVAFHVADNTRADLDALYTAATTLENDHRPCAGLFAAALARQGVKLGWPADWQALIHRLRAHPVPDVRAAALDIVMAPE
jgi:hypothetical protein